MATSIRVERNGRVYRVKAVKRGATLRPLAPADGLETLVILPFAFAYFWWLDRQQSYKVGVVIDPKPTAVFAFGRLVLHKELLPPGVDPAPRMRELADEVRAGRYDSKPH
ncbi:hypothetical protein OO014_15925 [Intrasporangium calvum]|uniref:Uncharacterized protein n=1 Tax=Intrasporangium calvum TaxID=53358 RepID=A0ABT5GKI6_9MICO|nr:hypothetical protein [Intrasporangium calvum]MDC5698744.1 hypothetical protein [Intrasporangium calvum]